MYHILDPMGAGDLALLAWCDLGAIMRTRPVVLDQLESKRRFGLGWAAAGCAMTPFDGIVANPWGSVDEVRQVPVDGASVIVAATAQAPALHLHLTRMLDSSGERADACPRNFCESALEALESETGLTLWTAFEHEFTVTDAPFRLGAVYSVEALRLAAQFAHDVTEAMRPVGIECFEPEFGKGQFEVSCAPLPNASGPDRAILAREVVREIARRHGIRATFSPKPILDGAGNGMHVHFSFRDRSGRPATHDPLAPGTVTGQVAGFIAGVMRHIGALTAVSAPAPVSYLRLGPGHWSCGYAAFGVQNREAALRVCPSPDRDAVAAAAATNIELRIPDGTANPYLIAGMLALAGLSGVRARLPLPAIVDGDPARLSDAERTALGVFPLPESLGAALDALEADAVAWNWMPPRLRDTFVAVKRMEAERFAHAEPQAVASAYREIY